MIINHWLKVKGVCAKTKANKVCIKCENFNFPIHSKLFQQSLKTSNKFESVCLKLLHGYVLLHRWIFIMLLDIY